MVLGRSKRSSSIRKFEKEDGHTGGRRRRCAAEQAVFRQGGRGGLQDQGRDGVEPFLSQPEALAPTLLPKPAPQVDRRADRRPAQPQGPGGRQRGTSQSLPFSFLHKYYNTLHLHNIPFSLFLCSLPRSKSSSDRPLSSPRRRRRRYDTGSTWIESF